MIFEEFAGELGAWADMFRPFIESKEMDAIYERLKTDGRKEVIVPSSDNTFKCFSRTVPEKVKSIWYLMDPYPRKYKGGANQATGIAMDCSNSPDHVIQPSLEIFYDGIRKDLGIDIAKDKSLEYLLEQGVMMLNTDLTCKLNKTASHERLWEPFQKFFLEEIMGKRAGIIYVLAGVSSKRMAKYINPIGNYIMEVEHPMAAGHRHTDWNHKGVFRMTDKILKERDDRIFWDKRKWDRECEPPF